MTCTYYIYYVYYYLLYIIYYLKLDIDFNQINIIGVGKFLRFLNLFYIKIIVLNNNYWDQLKNHR